MTSILTLDYHHDARGMTLSDFGIPPYSGSYDHRNLKDDVERALVAAFGRDAISRGNIAIHLRESARSLSADVVPCTSHRVYVSRLGLHHDGIKLLPDRGGSIINFPAQHLKEGIQKNDRTSKRYKKIVRILKRLENEMVSQKILTVVPSFLIESCVWNVDDSRFRLGDGWVEYVRRVLVDIYTATETDESSVDLLEANGIQLLFGSHQSWTREEANEFTSRAWQYIGFS